MKIYDVYTKDGQHEQFFSLREAKKFMKQHKHTKAEKEKIMAQIEAEMKQAAKQLNFERAAELRDILYEIRDED